MGRGRIPKTEISAARARDLRPAFERLLASRDHRDRLAADPLQAPHRYTDPRDQEIAALFASQLAFGRVSLFLPVINQILRQADERGGPRQWVETFSDADARRLAPLFYRWVRGDDLAWMAKTLQRTLQRHERLGTLIAAHIHATDQDVANGLAAAIAELRGDVEAVTGAPFASMSRGVKTMLSSPADGSACKRWNMLLRWMVRSEWPDLGIWNVSPAQLILPLDTHTLRISQLLGLTQRNDGTWRTAAEITGNLRRIDPQDPVRFDFALAHMGISGECQRTRVESVCSRCPMVNVCQAANPQSIGSQ